MTIFSYNDFGDHYKDESSKQGEWGERYVIAYLESKGYQVIKNKKPFGPWDLMAFKFDNFDGGKIGVKTMARRVKDKELRIPLGKTGITLHNIKSADALFVLFRTPPGGFPDPVYSGKLVQVKKHKNYEVKNNEYVIPADDNMSNFEVLQTLHEQELNELNQFRPDKDYKK